LPSRPHVRPPESSALFVSENRRSRSFIRTLHVHGRAIEAEGGEQRPSRSPARPR
jgi:hypothetical protein